MRQSIWKKIVAAAAAAIVAMTLIGMGISCSYAYINQYRQQRHRDEAAMALCANQCQTLLNDVRMLAHSVAENELVQRFYSQDTHEYFETIEAIQEIKETIHLRVHIKNAVLIQGDQVYWSYSPFEPYFEERLSEEWYQEIKDEREAFSRVHTCGYPENSRYLTYLLSIPDKGTPDKELGKLLLNINVQYFSDIIGETAGLSSGYFVSDLRDGTVILGQGNQETNIRLAEKMAASVQSEKKYRGEMEIGSGDKGYCLWSAFPDAGIGVGMYTSSGLLFQYSEQMRYFFVVYSVSTAAAILLLTFLLIRKFLQPISQISAAMLDFSGGKRKILEIKTGDELEMLSCQFNKMAERIEEFIKRRIQDERINKKLKFDMLMSKIHPHFLYNTLNSVIYLARRDHNQDIEKMVQSLILILQDGMAAYSGKSCAMLKEELEVVSAYCVIQNYRYKDKVSVSIEVPDELTTAYVPKNILQPLVENSIYHGIAPMEENGSVEILAEQREDMLDLWVIDTGIGMDEEELKGLEQNGKGHSGVHSIGIKSIRERLEYLYPEHYSFEIYSEKGKGTTILISVPYQKDLSLLREAEEDEGEIHEE